MEIENNKINTDTPNNIEKKEPASIQWIGYLAPHMITPTTWKRGGMCQIRVWSPDGKKQVNIYRSINRFKDGGIAVQDEAHVRHENVGGKFNYEFDRDGRLINYNKNLEFYEVMQRVVDEISSFIQMPGATIRTNRQLEGIEPSFTSNGTEFVDDKLRDEDVPEDHLLSTDNDRIILE